MTFYAKPPELLVKEKAPETVLLRITGSGVYVKKRISIDLVAYILELIKPKRRRK